MLQVYCVKSLHLNLKHLKGMCSNLDTAVIAPTFSSDKCSSESDGETVPSSSTSTDEGAQVHYGVVCLIIAIYVDKGSQWVICSISMLIQLASGKCQEAH